MEFEGQIRKMRTELHEEVHYFLPIDDQLVHMNDLIGKEISIAHTGIIRCLGCNAVTKKSFNQGFCYKCFVSAPENSECVIRPELCRGHLGEGRDVEWEQKNHVQPHFVYLAVSSAVKVGVTRATQIPTRWIDQGASYAIKVAETPNRYLAGVIEVALKDQFTDKTNWRKMLKNEVLEGVDLEEEKWQLEEMLPSDLTQYFTEDDEVVEIHYPTIEYPQKITSINFEKTNKVEGKLMGIKGQYLFLNDGKVFNIRRHGGYVVHLSANN